MQSRSPISRRMSLLLASLITILAHFHRTRAGNLLQGVVSVRTKKPIAVNVLVGQSRVINFDQPGRTFLGFESGDR